MRFEFLSIPALLALNSCFASAQPLQITVRIFNTVSISDRWLSNAEELAGKLYAGAGINIHWIRGDRKQLADVERETPQPVLPGCASADQIDVMIQAALPGTVTTPLAVAHPFRRSGIRIRIPIMQIVAFARRSGVPVNVALGFVLAHEIGHILSGTDSHSSTGIMRPRLTPKEMRQPLANVHVFTPDLVATLRHNVHQSRSGCPQTASVP